MTQEAEQVQTENTEAETPSEVAVVDNQVADNQNETTDTNDGAEPVNVYDHVDPATSDPKLVQARIDTLYRERQTEKAKTKELMDVAKQQAKLIEELQTGVYAVAEHLQKQNFADNEATLKAQYRTAVETGDIDGQIAINDKLLELKAQKMTAPKVQPKQAPQQEQQKQYNSAQELAEDLDPQEQAITSAWQSEKDESGQPLRPWAVNSTGDLNDPDPDYIKAVTIAHQIFTKENFAHLNYQQKLQEIDKRMGVKKSAPQQNVISTHLTGQRKNSKVVMTDKQREIAVRTKFGGPKAKSDAEHIEAFRKQIENVQSKKGAR